MRYYNADGRPGRLLRQRRALPGAVRARPRASAAGGVVRFRTAAGVQGARRAADGRAIELHFGARGGRRAARDGRGGGPARSRAGAIRAGVPHFVTAVERVEWVPVAEWGAALRRHARFGAERRQRGLRRRRWARGRVRDAHLRARRRGRDAGLRQRRDRLGAVGRGRGRTRRRSTVLTAGGDELVVSFAAVDRAAAT